MGDYGGFGTGAPSRFGMRRVGVGRVALVSPFLSPYRGHPRLLQDAPRATAQRLALPMSFSALPLLAGCRAVEERSSVRLVTRSRGGSTDVTVTVGTDQGRRCSRV